MKAGLLTLQQDVMPNRLQVRQAKLEPGYRYLLVEQQGREALLVWIGNESSALGETSVWLSADGVVVRLVEGRLVGVAEPNRNWRLTSETPLSQQSSSQLKQTSDEQPGFHMGLVRTVTTLPLPVTARPMPWVDGEQNLNWLEEIDVTTGQRLALYAVNERKQTIAGQRCLGAEWCLRWQTWPATKTAQNR
jgi:hypothetical protein